MQTITILEVRESILNNNDELAKGNRERLRERLTAEGGSAYQYHEFTWFGRDHLFAEDHSGLEGQGLHRSYGG